MYKYYYIEIMAGHCCHINDGDLLGFYIKARDIVHAMRLARRMPGTKHHRNNAIKVAKQIPKEEYINHRNRNAYKCRENPIEG